MSPSNSKAGTLSDQFQQRKGTRAPRACLSCRARKVRCDIAYKGGTCTNCQHENMRCITPSTRRNRQPQYIPEYQQQEFIPTDERVSRDGILYLAAKSASTDTPTSSLNGSGQASSGGIPFGYTISHHSSTGQDNDGPHESLPISSRQDNDGGDRRLAFASDDARLFTGLIAPESTEPKFTSPVSSPKCHENYQAAFDMPAEVIYHYYPFTVATKLRRIPPQDLHFLELQGCLLVPAQPLLDEFVREYFLHVHPVLPLINEGEFWELYELSSRPSPDRCIPLLLLQAMLFAASPFVSQSTLQSLGHANGRSMRIALLRRAKLLSDLEVESSHIAIAQASVLLSTASVSSSGRLNTTWLSHAIENAMLAEAHLYSTLSSASNPRKRRILKRLWWCCILRDRSMALLLKRPVHIYGKQFALSKDSLGIDDLQDEFDRSKVYSSHTKWKLAKILSQLAQLCVKMTDLLTFLSPGYLKPRMSQPELRKGRLLLDRCRSDLRDWHSEAVLEISSSAPHTDDVTLASTMPASELGSVTLYTNLVYMYYHAACIALCHLEVFYSDMNCSHTASRATATLPVDTQTQDDLQTAISSLTACHEELLSQDLAQWLPQAALAFIGFPLILNILNINLSSPPMEAAHDDSCVSLYRRTSVFIHFMEVYCAKYEGVDWFGDIVRHIANLARLGAFTIQRNKPSITWKDVLACQPRSYLRLVMVLDLGLVKSRLPRDTDFPVELRGLFSVDLNAPRGLIGSCCSIHDVPGQTVPSNDSSLDSAQVSFTMPDSCHIDTREIDATLDPSDETETETDPARVHETITLGDECSLAQPLMTPLNAFEPTCSDLQSLGLFSANLGKASAGAGTFGSDCQIWESGLETSRSSVDQAVVDRMFDALMF